jgi:hypothetical protein
VGYFSDLQASFEGWSGNYYKEYHYRAVLPLFLELHVEGDNIFV